MLLIGRDRHLGNGCDFVLICPVTVFSVWFTKIPLLASYIATFLNSIAHYYISSSFKQGCQCLIMITVAWPLTHYHDVISNYNHILQVSKALGQLALKHISCHCSSKRHHCISESPKLSVEGFKKG